jgi:flagellar L-ring protein precursor FlgH
VKLRYTIFLFLFLLCGPAAQAESLYDETTYRGLADDTKAGHIGDSLTVLVYESSSAETKNATDTTETSNNSVNGSTDIESKSLAVDTASNYKNGGDATRSGKLLARVTVTVHEILPTGELRVKGSQKIQINDELQEITLAGNIRPIDIDASNTVLSTKIANARIIYKGKGYTSDDKPGVITQFFRWLF